MAIMDNIVKYAYYEKDPISIKNPIKLGVRFWNLTKEPQGTVASDQRYFIAFKEGCVMGFYNKSKETAFIAEPCVPQNNDNSVATEYFAVVADVGVVHHGEFLSEAVQQYGVCVLRSIHGRFGFARKTVTLLEKDVLVMQYAWLE